MIKNILSEFKYRRRRRKIIRLTLAFLFVSIFLIILSSQTSKIEFDLETYHPKIEKSVEINFDGEVYFNDEINTTVFTDLIVSQIESAKESIHIAMYSFDMQLVRDALVSAYDRGVDVTLVFDQSKKEQHDHVFADDLNKFKIFHIGGDIETSGDYMHHKFMIVDPETSHPSLLMGSLNYTRLQELYDPSFIMKTSDPDLIEAFNDEFELLTEDKRGYKKFREESFQPFSRNLTYNNGHVEAWFSPGFKSNSVKQRMLDLIEDAGTSIDIMIWRMTDEDIAKSLFIKASEGVNVRILTDDLFLLEKNSAIMHLYERVLFSNNQNIEIVSDFSRVDMLSNENLGPNFNPFLHQHTIIVDDLTVLTGTNNWSYNGFHKNDESVILTDVPNVVDAFIDSFNNHYEYLSEDSRNYLSKDPIL